MISHPKQVFVFAAGLVLVVTIGCQDSGDSPEAEPPVSPTTTKVKQPVEEETQEASQSSDLSEGDRASLDKSDDVAVGTKEVQESSETDKPFAPIQLQQLTKKPLVKVEKPTSTEGLREEASGIAKDLGDNFAKIPDALEVKARIHLLLGETEQARAAWKAALELAPEYAYAKLGIGRLSALAGEYEQAVTLLSEAQQGMVGLPEASHMLADAYLKLGDNNKCLEVLKAQAELRPQNAETHMLIGQSQLLEKNFAAAKDSFKKALSIEPEMPKATEGLAKALLRLGNRAEAKELLELQRKAREQVKRAREPAEVFRQEQLDYAPRYIAAARIYRAVGGQAENAMLLIKKACILAPSNLEAWTLQLDMYQRANDIKAAVEVAGSMCEANENEPSCFFTLAMLQQATGNVDAAQGSFRKVISLAPNDASAYEQLVRLSVGMGQSGEELIKLGKKLIELRPNAASNELVAQVYAVSGDYDQAGEFLRKAIELEPENKMYQNALQQLEKFRAQK